MALKLYSAAAATDYEQLREMIDNEIAVHSSLCHPHILRFYGAFREDDYLALVLQLAPQGDLLGVMGRIPRDEHTVSRLIAAPLLSALAYLHGRGLVHRDIKPENVFVDDSDVFLGDFGFARSQRRGTLRSAVGTVHFMAPEILRNTLEGGRWGDYVPRDERVPYGPEVDVWSLGVVLYELLTRRLPFTGDSQQSVCDAVLAGPPPPPQDPLISLPRLPVAHAHDRPCAARHKPRAAYAPLHPRPHQPRVGEGRPRVWQQLTRPPLAVGVLGFMRPPSLPPSQHSRLMAAADFSDSSDSWLMQHARTAVMSPTASHAPGWLPALPEAGVPCKSTLPEDDGDGT